MAHYTPSQRRIVRRRAVRALRSVYGMNRADARRHAYRPQANAAERQANTTTYLQAAIARAWGIPLASAKDGAAV